MTRYIAILTATNINAQTIAADYTFSVANSPYYTSATWHGVVFLGNVYIENGVEIIFAKNT